MLQGPALGAGGHVPEADGRVGATRRQGLAVGGERQRPDWSPVIAKRLTNLTRHHIPQPYRAIVLGHRQRGPIRRQGRGPNRAVAPVERLAGGPRGWPVLVAGNRP